MKLEFDSVEDLGHFLTWATTELAPRLTPQKRDSSVAFDTPPAVSPEIRAAVASAMRAAGTLTADDATDGTPSAGDETKPADNPEPAKRKRRTKAEIEADTAAAAHAASELLKAQENGTIVTEGTPNAGEASLEAARATLRDKAQDASTTPAGTNPFDVPPAATAAPAEAAGEPVDTTVTPFKHLTRAREFIAKHGMPKYNETFAKAELDTNVMGYTAEQRALHLAAMDALEQA